MIFHNKIILMALWLVFTCITYSQDTNQIFTVLVPSSTPKDGIVYIAGDHPLLGNWNPGAVPLVKINDSIWSKTFFGFPRKLQLEYKITLGSWNSQARYVTNEIPGNSRIVVGEQKEVIIRPIGWSSTLINEGSGITGDVKYHRNLQGKGLNYARDIIVWLPPSYEKNTNLKYPVLYMHDGQNIIDPNTSFIGYDWHVDEVADSLIRIDRMEEIIIVGVYNSPDRIPEYSDSELGKAYVEFIVNSVKPLIDSTYRTKREREHTAVMGSSMGGLISFLFVWWHPEVFSKAGCLSSVFDMQSSNALDLVRKVKGKTHDVKFYFDCGGYSWEANLRPGMEEMAKLLKNIGYRENKDLVTYYDPNAEHSERAWAARVWRPLLFLFGR